MPDDKHERLKALAKSNSISVDRLMDELATVALASYGARSPAHRPSRDPPEPHLYWPITRGGNTLKVEIETLPEQCVAALAYVGPYNTISVAFARLGDAWVDLIGRWLAPSGHRVGGDDMFELYRNSPMDTPPSDLVTDLYLSIA